MDYFFRTLLTMSSAAAVTALLVMLLRLPLKKAPRWITCALWAVVLFRMVCPVSFEAPVSAIPPQLTQSTQVVLAQTDTVSLADFTPVQNFEPDTTQPAEIQPAPVHTGLTLTQALTLLWAVGTAGMLLWGIASTLRLRRMLADAIRLEGNIYESDRIPTPFVCGFLRPRIYLPVGLSETDRTYVILHEQAHIRRWDHRTKPIAWLALSLHWFNPVLWLAYRLFGRDIETACDEAVVKNFDRADTAGYAEALFHLSRKTRLPAAVPLAFGEENASRRIEGVLSYRKQGIAVAGVALLVCLIAGGILLANPTTHRGQMEGITITQVQVYHHNAPVTLPDDLRDELTEFLRTSSHSEYTDVDSVPVTDGCAVLSNPNHGTVFTFDPNTMTLYRTNHDGYSSIRKQALLNTSLSQNPDFLAWQDAVADYCRTGRADAILAARTPYIGNHVADGNVLSAMGVPEVVGNYTMALQTTEEPYGITLTLHDYPPLAMQQAALQQYLSRAGELFLLLVDNAGSFTWEYPNGHLTISMEPEEKSISEDDLYNACDYLQEAAGTYLSRAVPTEYQMSEVLYFSHHPEETEHLDHDHELDFALTGTYTIAPHAFAGKCVNMLSSAFPQDDHYENVTYARDGNLTDLTDLFPDLNSLGPEGWELKEVQTLRVLTEEKRDTGYRVYSLLFRSPDDFTGQWEQLISHVKFQQGSQNMIPEYLFRITPVS